MVSMWAHVIEENIIATVKTWARNGGRGKGGNPKRCILGKSNPKLATSLKSDSEHPDLEGFQDNLKGIGKIVDIVEAPQIDHSSALQICWPQN